jgi:RNA polymerase sigma factor (TIGR02999 family)
MRRDPTGSSESAPAAPTEGSSGSPITSLLASWAQGDAGASDRLLPIVYAELKAIARQVFRRERGDHTLQPTAVVHEAFLKLAGGAPVSFRDRAHFFAVASQAMRQVLVDHARARTAGKRGAGATRMELGEEAGAEAGAGSELVDVLAVDQALERLTAVDPGLAQIVTLRFFGGLTVEEAAEVVGVSTPTIKRDWRLAKAFLARELA